jgi:HSF-type DNA-binding
MAPANAKSRAEFEDLFPAKLHYVLEQVEKDGGRDVIAWRSHGKAFLVKDREKFVKYFLPKYVTNREARSQQSPGSPSKRAQRNESLTCLLLILCWRYARLSTVGFDKTNGHRSSGSSINTTSSE